MNYIYGEKENPNDTLEMKIAQADLLISQGLFSSIPNIFNSLENLMMTNDASFYSNIHKIIKIAEQCDGANQNLEVTLILKSLIRTLQALQPERVTKEVIYEIDLMIADNFQKTGKFSEAIAYLEEACTLCEEICGEKNIYLIGILDKISKSYVEMLDLEKLIQVHQAWSQLDDLYHDENFVSSFQRLANLYSQQNDLEKANFYFEEGIKKAIDHNNIESAIQIINNYGKFALETKNFRKAEEQFQKAIDLVKSTKSQNPLILAISKKGLGISYFNRDQVTKAKSCLTESLNLLSSQMEEMSTERGEVLTHLANISSTQENYEKSIQQYEQALSAFCVNAENNKMAIARVYEKIGEIYSETGKPNHALKKFSTALEIYESNQEYERMGFVLCLIGNLYHECGQSNNAMKAYRDSMKYHSKMKKNSEISEVFYNMGSILDCELNYRESISMWAKAKALMKKSKIVDNSHAVSSDIRCLEQEQALLRFENDDKIFLE